MTDSGTDLAEQFVIHGDFITRDGRRSTHYVASEMVRLQPEAAAAAIDQLLTDLEDSAQDVLSLADKVMAIERMHPAGVSPPHELGDLPQLCAGCDALLVTDDETEEIHSLSTDELNAIWDEAEPAGDPDDDTWAGRL